MNGQEKIDASSAEIEKQPFKEQTKYLSNRSAIVGESAAVIAEDYGNNPSKCIKAQTEYVSQYRLYICRLLRDVY